MLVFKWFFDGAWCFCWQISGGIQDVLCFCHFFLAVSKCDLTKGIILGELGSTSQYPAEHPVVAFELDSFLEKTPGKNPGKPMIFLVI